MTSLSSLTSYAGLEAIAPLEPSLRLTKPESAGIACPAKRDLFGVKVSITDYTRTVNYLIDLAKRRQPALVDFAPANILVEAASNPEFRARINDFDLVCPDGQPVRWCLNHFHDAQLSDRVYGPNCTLLLCEAAEREGISVYLYGASPETLALLQTKLADRFPRLIIAGAESPPFRPLTEAEDAAAIERINRSGAGLVFLGIGSPKQENFAWSHRDSINGVQLCVGAAFDFIAGTKRMAPAWMQRRGLEWLFRLVTEPKRLLKRYTVTNSLFIAYVVREKLRRGFGHK